MSYTVSLVAVVTGILLLPCSGSGLTDGVQARLCALVPSTGRVAVDGVLDDETWTAAPELVGFTLLGGDGDATVQTVARVAWDDEGLYVAVECAEPHPEHLVAQYHDRDDPVWFDDCVEVFVSPHRTGTPYFQFVVNCLGTCFDSAGVNHGWNGEWEATARIAKDHWTAELAIPWEAFPTAAPKEGDVWRINICRERQSGPQGSKKSAELSSWSTCLRQFHEPEHYGHALFIPGPPSVLPLGELVRICGEGAGAGACMTTARGEVTFISHLDRAREAIRSGREEVEAQREQLQRSVDPAFAVPGLTRLAEAEESLKALHENLAGAQSISAREALSVSRQVDEIKNAVSRLIWDARFAELLAGETP